MSPSRDSSRRQRSTALLTGTHIYNFLKCHHLLYLDELGDQALRDPDSDLEESLREKGKAHEEAALKSLGFEIAEVACGEMEGDVRETLRLMRAGEKYIYQGLLSAPGMLGRPDLLKRIRGESRLGSHYYIPLELKSGSAYEDEENGVLKRHYALQLAFYSHLLGKVQGVRPDVGKVIDGETRTVNFELADWRDDYEATVAEMRAILGRKTVSEPEISSGCGQCHWRSCCVNWAKKADDLTLIRNLGGDTRDLLRAAGIMTMTGLAALERRRELPVLKGITSHKLRRFVRRASVMKRGKPMLRTPQEFPKAAVELFFDIETDPEDDTCYLYGVVERRGGKQRYLSFFADSPSAEKKTWNDFWKYISGLDDFHMYHYSQYEKKKLKKLTEKHRCNQRVFDRLFKHCTDLYQEVVDRNTEWPSPSYSLKAISKILGFHYSEHEPGGLKAAKWYSTYVQDPAGNAELKQKLLRYNEEDCLAMIVVRDWVVAESKKMNRQGELGL